MELQKLESQAEMLKAVNSAKHKAAGRTHRLELHLPRKVVKVFYVSGTDAEAEQKAIRKMFDFGAPVLTNYKIDKL